MARVQTSRRNCRRAVMAAPWLLSLCRLQIRYTHDARRFGEVAELAEGSRLLSGYRGKTSVPGSNPLGRTTKIAHFRPPFRPPRVSLAMFLPGDFLLHD